MAEYAGFVPAGAVALAALLALFGDIFSRDRAALRGTNTFIAVVGIAAAAWALAARWGRSDTLFGGMWVFDPMSQFGALLVLGAGLVLLAASWRRRFVEGGETEYYGLLMLSLFGAMVMAGATNLVVLYLAIEMTTMPLYVMVAFSERSKLGGEGALKYFIQGLLTSLVMVYGMSFLYGVTGTTDLAAMAQQAGTFAAGRATLFSLAVLLTSAGFLFKLAAVPFHFWAPDVYEGAPTVVTAAIAFVPKVAGLIGLLRIYPLALAEAKAHWAALFAVAAVASMVIGNLLAFPQRNAKRLLAYSAIAHAGYILIGVAAATPQAVSATLFYLLAYGAGTLGALLVLVACGAENIDDLNGLGRKRPLMAVSMFVFLLSLVGIPPFVGFVGKLLLFGAAIEAGLAWLAVLGVINSVISVGYYFYFVKAVFLTEPEEEAQAGEPRGPSPERDLPAAGAVVACLAVTAVLGVAFGPLTEFLARVGA